MSDHCTRQEILSGARKKRLSEAPSRKHLKSCPDCKRMWDVALAFAGAHLVRLSHAPSGWVERAVAIGRKADLPKRAAAALGRLVSDSWANPAFAGLRGQGDTEARRLNWETGSWTVELRAESGTKGWDMVAQVLHDGNAVTGTALQFNADRVHTDAAGIAIWSGPRPPRRILLTTTEGVVQLEGVKWSRPKKS